MTVDDPLIAVVDTSSVLSDPHIFTSLHRVQLVLPVVVISELESKRHHPELGWAARQALHKLEEFRLIHGSLTEDFPVNDHQSTLRIELNHVDCPRLPSALADNGNDYRVLSVAANLEAEHPTRRVVLLTKDLPLRLKASIAGVESRESLNATHRLDTWTGVVDIDVDPELIDTLHEHKQTAVTQLPVDVRQSPVNTCFILRWGSQSVLARLHPDGMLRTLRTEREVFGVRGRSAEQRFAIDVLTDPAIDIVSLGGPAGTGKSAMALASGLEAVIEQGTHRKVMVFRPLFAVGGQDLGYLPGDEHDKMAPWAAATFDVLNSLVSTNTVNEIVNRKALEVLPLTHIRGRSLQDAYVIVDEAQNLERTVLLTALTRLGTGCKVVLTHDVAQRDNLRVGRYDGVAAVVDALRDQKLFAHVSLRRSERGRIAETVARLLDTDD